MSTEVRVPALPESVADATVAAWHKQPGDPVRAGDNLVDLETDKVILEVPAPLDGILGTILAREGETLATGAPLALIEPADAAQAAAKETDAIDAAPDRAAMPATGAMPSAAADHAAGVRGPGAADHASSVRESVAAASARADHAAGVRGPGAADHAAGAKGAGAADPARPAPDSGVDPIAAPAARRLLKELNIDPRSVPGSGRDGRIHKSDVMTWLDAREGAAPERDPEVEATARAFSAAAAEAEAGPSEDAGGRPEQRVPMTRLRARIAERLLEAQRQAAMLTTFNEVNLRAVLGLRDRYREVFEKNHGTRLGLMSFFVKAAVEALQRFPVVNAMIEGNDILYRGYYDIGIAVSSPRGLVVPVLRDCDRLDMAAIEHSIAGFGVRAKEGSLSLADLTGGTFSITNGGVFGSLLSTPILNPPQSAILGMHKIQERPIVENGQIVAAPMMYLALTYDHRLIDGREAVGFLVAIKEVLEDPARLLLRV